MIKSIISLQSNFIILYSTTVFILFSSLFLTSCGGGNSATLPALPRQENPCSQNQLLALNNVCIPAVQINIDGLGAADGIDLSGNGIPEIMFVPPISSPTTGLDIDGNGSADYYLKIDKNNKQSVYENINASGKPVLFVINKKSQVIGIDNGKSIDYRLQNLLSDSEIPNITVTPNGGNFPNPSRVVITCSDDIACNAIAYTTDGVTTPDFSGNSIISLGRSAELTIGDAGDGQYILKTIARDVMGKISTVKTITFNINTNLCASPPTANAGQDIEIAKSETGKFNLDGTLSTANNASNSIKSYSWQQLIKGDETDLTSGVDLSIAQPLLPIPNRITSLTFSLSVTDNAGCSSKVTDTVKVFILEDPSSAVYVNGGSGNDSTGTGSRIKPFATISKALSFNSGSDIYVSSLDAGVSYVESATLRFPTGVSLYGGFNSNWIRDVNRNRTKLDGNVNAIEFSQVNSNAILSGFKITSKNSIIPGESVVSLKVVSGLATLTIQDNDIISGNAINGTQTSTGSSYGILSANIAGINIYRNNITAGLGGTGGSSNGMKGASGATGQRGQSGRCPGFIARGGIGGVSPQSTLANGGQGGDNAQPGQPVCGGRPGRSSNRPGQGFPATCPKTQPLVAPSATVGGLSFGNNSITGLYSVANGNQGQIGAPGLPGGGGGGGGDYLALNPRDDGVGGGGGGGGAGGNGGGAGPAGKGGGGSFAIYLAQTNTSLVTISNNILDTKNGGAAGRAGNGGIGGPGGIGGQGGGGQFCTGQIPSVNTGDGGSGSNGGQGGNGGDGSGGGGGATVGIFVNTGLIPNINTNTINIGSGGKGGDGRHGAAGNGGDAYGIYAVDSASTLTTISNNTFNIGKAGIGGIIETGGTSTIIGKSGISARKN